MMDDLYVFIKDDKAVGYTEDVSHAIEMVELVEGLSYIKVKSNNFISLLDNHPEEEVYSVKFEELRHIDDDSELEIHSVNKISKHRGILPRQTSWSDEQFVIAKNVSEAINLATDKITRKRIEYRDTIMASIFKSKGQ